MKTYRNFVVHMDYDDAKEKAHIIINETETGDTIERTIYAKDFDNLARKVGDECYLAFTNWMYTLRTEAEYIREDV